MNKEDLKKIKVLYYPYKAVKKLIHGIKYNVQYTISLFYISKNKKRVAKKINNNEVLNVVFVVQYIPGWNKLEPIYSKMQKDQRFNPIIVCVPLNIQNHVLLDNNGNDTYQYFVDHGYKAINALLDDGSWFDLKQLKPDYLFHSRPYNHFMPKCYISGEIAKYALICNVMYGACLSKNEQKVCINLDYFKDVYIYFSFDKSESIYYKKVNKPGFLLGIQKSFPYGATGIEQILKSKKENKNSRFKKTVLWTPRWSTDSSVGGSNFFNYKDTMVRLAEENKDVLFIFRPHPLMFPNFVKHGQMTEQDAVAFKSYCHESDNIILDQSKEYSDTFWNSDFLITDLSGIVPEYFVTKKPVVYCHSNVCFKYTDSIKRMIHSCYEAGNCEDVITYFYQLIDNKDPSFNKREECIKNVFSNVEHNSANIIKSLLS